jgi:hypothetical protein
MNPENREPNLPGEEFAKTPESKEAQFASLSDEELCELAYQAGYGATTTALDRFGREIKGAEAPEEIKDWGPEKFSELLNELTERLSEEDVEVYQRVKNIIDARNRLSEGVIRMGYRFKFGK